MARSKVVSARMAAKSTKHVFPFLNLPAELRDIIYDYSLTIYTTHMSSEFLIEAKGVARVHLLLISKQFKSELEERAKKHSRLRIKDVGVSRHRSMPRPYTSFRSILRFPAIKTRKLVLQLQTTRLERHLPDMKRWIELLLPQIQDLAHLDIRIVTVELNEEDVEEWKEALTEQKWYQFRVLERVRVINSSADHYYDSLHGEVKGKVALEWLKQTGDFAKVVDGEEVLDEAEDKDVVFDARET